MVCVQHGTMPSCGRGQNDLGVGFALTDLSNFSHPGEWYADATRRSDLIL